MGANGEKLLRTLEILKDTNEANPLNSVQIAEKLCRDFGLKAEHKAVQRYIADLKQCGYEIIQHPDNKRGFYMQNKDFEDWQLKVLIDAVQSAKFLSQDDTDKIVNALLRQTNADSRKTLKLMTIPADSKRGSFSTRLAIDRIMHAIRSHNKVHFDYVFTDDDMHTRHKHPEGTKPVSPYALVWRKDKYFLIGNYAENKHLSYYRLDRIRNIEIMDERAASLQDILGSNAEQKLREFVKKNIYNKRGEYINLLLALRSNGVDTIMDSFGEDVRVRNNEDGTLSVLLNVSDSEGLYTWLMHHGMEVSVLKPERVREEMRRRLSKMLDNYS